MKAEQRRWWRAMSASDRIDVRRIYRDCRNHGMSRTKAMWVVDGSWHAGYRTGLFYKPEVTS